MSSERRQNPIAASDHGYLFAGGSYQRVGDETVMTGQMYVEYWKPKRPQHPYPVVLITGGGQSATNYTGTPDGRPGWVSAFLARGYTVYVADQPARGRSSYHPDIHGETWTPAVEWVERRFTPAGRHALWPTAPQHSQWPGSGTAGDPVFDQFYASQMRSLKSGAEMEALNRHAVAALLDEIGPAIMQTHSQSGAYGWAIADARPDLVRAILAVEPSGPPVFDLAMVGPPAYFEDNLTSGRPWGITNGPITFEPPAHDASELRFVRQAEPDAPDLARCWVQDEPARQLPTLQGIPILILVGEASYHAGYDHCTSNFLRTAGVEHSFVRLIDRGITGNGHMLMVEKNNLAVADVMLDWLAERNL
jgi:pimeloyl-ACP methyl ester carboxylesterase